MHDVNKDWENKGITILCMISTKIEITKE
jgi:hypothetical protein